MQLRSKMILYNGTILKMESFMRGRESLNSLATTVTFRFKILGQIFIFHTSLLPYELYNYNNNTCMVLPKIVNK